MSVPRKISHSHFRQAQKYFLDTFTKLYQEKGETELANEASLEDVKDSMCDFDEWKYEINEWLNLDYEVQDYVKINYERFYKERFPTERDGGDIHYFIMVDNIKWEGISNSDIELGLIEDTNFFYCDFDLLAETVRMRDWRNKKAE